MTDQARIQNSPAQSGSNSTTAFQSSPNNSTTSFATTLVDFSPPSRRSTGSTTSSTATYTSHSFAHSSNTTAQRQRRPQALASSNPPQPERRSVENRINRNTTMSPTQAELLRNKGTYTDSGRHSDDWLFGGWSFTGTVKGAWRKVSGNGSHGQG